MKNKIRLLTIIGTLLLSACSSPAPVVEEVAVPEIVAEIDTAAEDQASEEIESVEDPILTADAMSDVSFSQDVWPILEKYALAAHGGKGGVFLENYSDILMNVVPGNPEASLLYKALIGDGMKQMPPNNPLPDEMIQTIYDWIKQGAKEN